MEELTKLPGVGRKTANVVLGQAFGIAAGVVVDTHVFRVSRRLGFSVQATAEGVEEDLMSLFGRADWVFLGTGLLLHGRKTCVARTPRCPECHLSSLCPSSTV
jgi:endonuclease-3